jgi:hypothetical protein
MGNRLFSDSLKVATMLCTCIALCAANAQSDASATRDPNNALSWWDSQLASNEYIAVHAERRNVGEEMWRSHTQVYQPFKTIVNRDKNQIYMRVDVFKNFYGELFTYDDRYVYLHAETFPHISNESGPWDIRANRFRLFANITSQHFTASPPSGLSYSERLALLDRISQNLNADYSTGRVIMPLRINQPFDYYQLFNTYMCGLGGADGFQQAGERTGTLYQFHAFDLSVTVNIVDQFQVTYDGEMSNWTADSDFKYFDKALIVNQEYTAGSVRTVNDESKWGRERFIFGYKNGKYYGFIRWDLSKRTNGEWFVTARTLGLKILKSPEVTFEGMIYRGEHDPSLPGYVSRKESTNK